MSYTQDRDGYALESTFKDGTTLDDATDTAFLLGMLATRNVWPSPEFGVHYPATGVNAKEVGANLAYKGDAELRGMLTLMMQNGIPIWLAMGKSSTAASVHTITPTTDGTQLPSIVLQHEEKGDATDEEYQFQGVKVDSLVLFQNLKESNVLMAKLEIMAAYAVDPAFALDTDPALPATANTAPFIELTRTWDYGSGNLSIDGLQMIEVIIANGLSPVYADSWDTGVFTGMWPYMFTEAQRKQYRINIAFHPNTVERAMWDQLVTPTNVKELYLKWTRGTNDYIELTATDCKVIKHEIVTDHGKLKVINATLEPRALSFAVKDAVTAGAYGE